MAIRAATAVAGLSAAARRVASGLRHFAPRSARRGFVGDTAAFTRPLLPHAPLSGSHVLRRGLAVIPGEGDHSLVVVAEVSAGDIFYPDDPEAPGNLANRSSIWSGAIPSISCKLPSLMI
jgi:hypothetical protein